MQMVPNRAKHQNILKTSNQNKLIYIINNHAPVHFFFKKISTKLQSKKNGIYEINEIFGQNQSDIWFLSHTTIGQ